MLAFNSTFYFGAYFLLSSTLLYTHLIVLFTFLLILLSLRLFFTLAFNYLTRFYTYFLLIFTIQQQQERIRLKNQTKALYQATRRANPVLRSLEQSSDTARKRITREELGVREQRREQEQPANTRQRALAREEPGVREQRCSEQPADTAR